MEAIYLQSMTDFVLEQKEIVEASTYEKSKDIMIIVASKIFKYANFFKQPFQLGFFVPCGIRYQNVLEEPNYSKFENSKDYDEYVKTYSEAKERVLFKGFRLIANSNIPRIENGHRAIFLEDISKMKIEDLLQKWDTLELTETAIKQIGL